MMEGRQRRVPVKALRQGSVPERIALRSLREGLCSETSNRRMLKVERKCFGRERCRMKNCSALFFAFQRKLEIGKAEKTTEFSAKRAQINRLWGDPSAKCGKLFCFFVSGRHFLGRTGLQSAVFPLHPVLFQVEGNSKKEQFCADVCPASREESPESEIIFQQGKSALRLNGAAQAQIDTPLGGHAPLGPRTLLPEGFLQAKLFRLFRIFGAAALASAGTAGAAFTPIPSGGHKLSVFFLR